MKEPLSRYQWVLFAFWALCVNEINLWLIEPVVKNFAVAGVFVVLVILILWLVSIPTTYRNIWIGFTVFSLLLGQTILSAASTTQLRHEFLCTIGGLALLGLVWLYTKMPFPLLVICVFVLTALYLPVSRWASPSQEETWATVLFGIWILGGLALRYRQLKQFIPERRRP